MISRPLGEMWSNSGAGGSSIDAAAPPAPVSNALYSGPMSSQPSRRRRGVLAGRGVRSGARNGLASWRASTDGGVT
ncbi:Uncharacterised protein [Mycobacterium tuberculosis]|nr:Uncharacterised protein [Mycobacterium tuberculosis]